MTDSRQEQELRSPSFPFVSVIVPVYNMADMIGDCVEALLAQDYPEDRYEIIIVDNDSTDGTAEVIKRYPVKYILEDEVHTSYAARNAGARVAKGEALAFCDADQLATESWLANLLYYWPDERYVAFGGPCLWLDGAGSLLARYTGRQGFDTTAGEEDRDVDWWYGGNICFRAEAFRAAGGFDRAYAAGGTEPLCQQIREQTGKKILYIADALQWHRPRARFGAALRKSFRIGYSVQRRRGQGFHLDKRSVSEEARAALYLWARIPVFLVREALFGGHEDRPMRMLTLVMDPVSTTADLLGRVAYQMRLFYNALAKHGFTVERALKRDGWKLPMPAKGSLLHLHYGVQDFYLSRRYGDRLPVLARFILDVLMLKLRRGHLIWTCHNIFPHERGTIWVEWLARFCLAKVADAVFVHSESARRQFGRTYLRDSQVHVIPHGTYATVYDCEGLSKEGARRFLGIPHDSFVYLFFGNIRAYKGIPELLTAFRGIESGKARLVIAGSPSCPSVVQYIHAMKQRDARIQARLTYIPKNRVPYYVKASDVMVLPFRRITTSGSLILGLSFGLPVIVPACGFTRDLLQSDYPLLFARNSPEDLLAVMQNARRLDLAALSLRIRSVADKLSWDSAAEQFARVVREL